MNINTFDTKTAMGSRAAEIGGQHIADACAARGEANVIVATGASQFEMLESLASQNLPWHQVNFFHLDEYIGLPIAHPASFRLYLWQRFASKLAVPPKSFHFLDGEAEPQEEAARVSKIIESHPIDVAFVGIGENGHLAFNDPPADFEVTSPYIVVELDEACRNQQYGEGWFPTFDDVPKKAISMSVQQIMKSRKIICTVPDERKAEAVRNAVEGPVTPDVPASILQQHADCDLFLDGPAASLLNK
ncbi:MAG: glucosamine-6-phosphate deaminase [Planctomycetales bacterium]|nr:glucosamine-6-phosphate deaminase [Planctomycetales bacterium]